MAESDDTVTTRCCIAGGGPAGMMLGLLLARAGVPVVVLEKHADFLRDFRGDTVHPSTLEVLAELGLKAKFDVLPQQRVQEINALFADGLHAMVDFRGLKPFPYVALVPQWDFLDFLADEARRYPQFELRMQAEVSAVVRDETGVTGVVARTPRGTLHVHADVVVGCDGRHSTLRARSGLPACDLGAPMDVLWFRVPRSEGDPTETFGVTGRGSFMALLQRGDYWQVAYVIPKGSAAKLRERPIARFREDIARRVAFLGPHMESVARWDDVKLLEVRVDRLERWYAPGLLLIGDAAHAMSPIGGVGINLAIQDAVAAGNVLAPALREPGRPGLDTLAKVQSRRMLPTRIIQAVQLQIQKRVIAPALRARDDGKPADIPPLVNAALRLHAVRAIPARVLGLGVRREHVARDQREVPARDGVASA